MAEAAALNLALALVRGAIELARSISEAMDEAKTLLTMLPLVQAGLGIVSTSLGPWVPSP